MPSDRSAFQRWPLLLAAVFCGYAALLLWNVFGAQSLLRSAADARLVADATRRAAAIGNYTVERRNEVSELAQSHDIEAYLINKDLGMSVRYGLVGNMAAIDERFRHKLVQSILGGVPIYNRIVFYDATGAVVSDVAPADSAIPLPDGHREGATLTIDAERRRIVTTAPVTRSGTYRGVVVAVGDLRHLAALLVAGDGPGGSRHHELLVSPGGLSFSAGHDTAAPGPGFIRALEALPADVVHAAETIPEADASFAADLVLRTSVPGTPLQLVTLIDRDMVYGQLSSRFFLVAIAVFPLVLLAAALALNRERQRSWKLRQRNREVEQRVAEQSAALALEKERAMVTLTSIGDAVITTDANGRVEYLNAAGERLTGWSGAEARGRDLAEVFRVTLSAAAAPGPAARESLLKSREGPEIAIDQSVSPIRGDDGSVLGSVVVFRDVSRERKLAQEMAYQARHDALTGLLNRRAFEKCLEHLLCAPGRDGQQHALLYIDLDQFKIVNDLCGHEAGDLLLRQLCALLRNESRHGDALARLGGDEFGMLLPHCPLPEAEKVANKLLQTINGFHFLWKERTFRVGASIGLVPIDDESDGASRILSAADSACYSAKDKGRNRVQIYRADNAELSDRRSQMQWVTRLRRALEEDLFVLYSQPIVPIRGVGAAGPHHEVLLRLRGSDGAIVPPGAFLPAAERFGLMPEIDRWVVGHTLRWLARNVGRLGAAANYSINLSGQSLSDAKFLEFVVDELERSGVDPARVSFEITETVAVTAGPSALHLMNTLRQLGCRFLLDDFGSGWSSFAYLKNLPVDFLKIDGSLVRDIANDALDEAMVRAINEIGHVLGIATIAEFVESEDVLAHLSALGVDYAQGYGVGPPAPIDAGLEAPEAEVELEAA